ncbi:hypothetical protein CAPTEDRAFT_221592 [Capitella teleta]|uniref:Proteasome assembly chaperone 1 n=1 Tax=Capitella teleta TaxID=283909 RepID=R7UYN4_CAPTE|nr:hypothetical protein CAPTEDRAFT_221592 [Capitella teleta]|eukprot:ELU11444.1 hypothetical protein CAPTEDRAFT_221592 [Capitella teleta]
MASFFGEIVPALSRAVDEEDDDDELEYMPKCSISFKWNTTLISEETLKCASLVVAVGPAASAFMQIYMLNGRPTKLLGQATLDRADDDDDDDLIMMGQSSRSSPLSPCLIHLLTDTPSVVMMQCRDEVLPELTFSLVDQSFSKLNLSNSRVIVLTSVSVSQYRSELISDDLQVPFLRALKTDAETKHAFCPYLEQPNTIAGLSAQVLTLCQVKSVACCLYVVYSDLILPDQRTVRKFKDLEQIPTFKSFISVNSATADEQLAKLLDSKTKENTLYL